jgi:hypothetical protein
MKPANEAGHPWLTPIILATQEAENRRIEIGTQEIVRKTLSQKKKKPITEKGLVEWHKW